MAFTIKQKSNLILRNKETNEISTPKLIEKSHEQISQKSFKDDSEESKVIFSGKAPNGEKVTCAVTYSMDAYSNQTNIDDVNTTVPPLFEIEKEPEFEMIQVNNEED